jgi:hypothetical protein
MKRYILTAVAVLCLSATLAAQNQAALAILAQLDTEAARAKPGATRNTLRELLADLRVLLEIPVPPPVCPPPVCPTCPPPIVCPSVPVVDCAVSPWGQWSAWTPISLTDESRTRTRTVVTPDSGGGAVCPALTETETQPIPVVVPPVSTVSTAAELHAALRTPGVYTLASGTYVGNFTMAVDGVALIGAALPSGRVVPDATAGYRLIPADPSRATLTITASHSRVTGLWIGQGNPARAVVEIGSPDVADPLLQPDDVTLDRVEIVAGTSGGLRGIAAHTRAFTLTQSRIVGFWWQGADSQALLIVNGPGPYTVTDNQLQASAENLMVGGASIRSAAMVPNGITIQRNLIDKPQAWRQIAGSVKNSIEFKVGKNILVEDNLIDGMWASAQTGSAILLTPRNPYSDSPWVEVSDVVIRRNRLINHTDGFFANIMGHNDQGDTDPSKMTGQTARVTIEGNYADSHKGIMVNRGVAGWLRVRNNTWPNISPTTGVAWQFEPAPNTVKTPCQWVRNVFSAGRYGILGGGNGSGIAALDYYCEPGYVVAGNVIEAPVRSIWPYVAPNTNKFLSGPGLLAPLLDVDGHYLPDGSIGW